ncbi:uncharacterized protein LOC110467290 [Mizuhopecten yessoensis]|uniref:Uncharacterized protein n=1 Tax=Mizuhopecten yessoensis TaxID=6573 RepID=A0A210PM90_MIZYE|nr:uncharacterized protein LOC110467290 [Mizuhopecten yessoensis]OWF37546.1 hypothetical protein KP79_PYT07416 [Mizuhopecten yessoensis]
MSTHNAEFQAFKQQKAAKKEALREERAKGAKHLHWVGVSMLVTSLGLLISSSLFVAYVNKSENLHLGTVPIGLFAALLGIAGGLCEYCASRTIVESEAKGCSKSLIIGNFVLSFVALGQCVIASGFAGSTYSTCMEDPGPPPDADSWFSDFRQCVSYRTEVRTFAIFMILFGIALGLMSVASIVVYCIYKTSFGIYHQAQMLMQVQRDVPAIQHILNMHAQYPDRNTCSNEELQQLQGYITEIQERLTEAASIPQRNNAGAPIMLMNLQAQVTTLQQTLNTHIQMSGQPQQPGYPTGGPGQMYYPQGGQGQPPYHQGQYMPYSQGQAQPMNYPQGGQGQHAHYPQDHNQGQAGGQPPPSYEFAMTKYPDADTKQKNWV